jgi:hypothetical protein
VITPVVTGDRLVFHALAVDCIDHISDCLSPFWFGAIAFVYLKYHHRGPGAELDDFADLNKEEAIPR